MITFKMVPIPGICLRGIQHNKTKRLMKKVAFPMLRFNTFEIPWPRTVHGLTPIPAAMSKASPKPNRINPIIKNTTEINLGVAVNAFEELQNKVGIFFVDRNSNLILNPTPYCLCCSYN